MAEIAHFRIFRPNIIYTIVFVSKQNEPIMTKNKKEYNLKYNTNFF